MKVVSIVVALLSLSSRIVRHAMIAGIPQPVPITTGITDFPERPTLLKIGSITALTRAMYPQSSRRAIRKYITITRGRNPTTAPTPPTIPSARSAERIAGLFSSCPATHPWNVSIQPTSQSAIRGPSHVWEIQNTPNITAAKISIPAIGFVSTASSLSALPTSVERVFLFSTSATILFTKS